MMKRMLPVFLLFLAFVLQGCGGTNQNTCRFAGRPDGRYAVGYPDGFLLMGTADALGVFLVPNRGYSCGALVVQTGINFGLSLSASPASVYLPSPPAAGTVTGQSFDATYGMPSVDYFDSHGYLVGSVYATSVSGDGTSLQANLPDLSYVYSGNYQVKVTNKTYEGYYLNIVGSAAMTAWGRDRPDSDGDGWYDDEDCAPDDPSLNQSCTQSCGGDENGMYSTYEQICPY